MDKSDCPVTYEIGFTVKTHRRKRKIPLDQRSIDFIKEQLKRHAQNQIYGKVSTREEDKNTGKLVVKKIEYIEYRFLFPILRNGCWQRCDCQGHIIDCRST